MDTERTVSTATNPDIDAAGATLDTPVASIFRAAPERPDDKPEGFSVVGKALPKPDAFGKVTGAANYADDIVLPRMLFGKLLRSKFAHARVKRVDASRALGMPGVVAVMTGADLAGEIRHPAVESR